MLSDKTLEIIRIQKIVSDEFLGASLYARKIQAYNPHEKRWIFIKGCLVKQVIIQWCQMFGSDGEQIHWKHVADSQSLITPFSRELILSSIDSDLNYWVEYRNNMLRLRDKFFAHFDMDTLNDYIPSFEPAINITLAYRDWLIELIKAAKETGQIIPFNLADNDRVLSEYDKLFYIEP